MVKLESLKKSNQFKKVLKEKKVHSEYFSLFAARNFYKPKSKNDLLISFVIKKKIGNAVARNRVKRAIREIFRQVKHQMIPATDIVVISGKEMVVESYKVIDEKLSNALLAIK